MKYFCVLLLASCSCALVSAQVPGILSVPPDARSSGMGDAGISTSPDAASQHWNVAKYAFAENSYGDAEFSYTPWMRSVTDGMNLFYLSGYGMIGLQAISASLSYFSMGDFSVTNSDGTPLASSPRDLAVDVGYSRRFGRLFSIGLAFRYISTNYQERETAFAMNTAGAFAADLGAYFRLPVSKNEWTAGIALSNVGSKLDMGGQKVSLPASIGIGTQYAWQIEKTNVLRFAMDINQPLVSLGNGAGLARQLTVGGGAEYSYLDRFFVRGGYYYNNAAAGDRSHATVGAGLCFYAINLDCSYLIATGDNNNALKNTLRFTLGYTFATKTR